MVSRGSCAATSTCRISAAALKQEHLGRIKDERVTPRGAKDDALYAVQFPSFPGMNDPHVKLGQLYYFGMAPFKI